MMVFIACAAVLAAFAMGIAIGWFSAWDDAEFRYTWNKYPFHNPRISVAPRDLCGPQEVGFSVQE